MTSWARHERAALVRLLHRLGPEAPVVPAGWRTRDMAAHLYVREHRPDAAPGVVVGGPAAAYTERVMASVLRVHGYDDVVRRVGAGPPVYLRPVDELMNLFEFYVHHEDVRRANGEGPRELASGLEHLLWGRLRRSARMLFRRARGIRVELVTPAGDRSVIGRGPVVRVTGPPGELVLVGFGRLAVADVTVTGDDDAVRELRGARLGP